MKYKVEIGFMVGDSQFEEGQLLEEKDIPKKSKKWIIEQGIIVKKSEADLLKEANEKAGKTRARNEKGHFIADNPNTDEDEAWVDSDKEEE